MSDRADDATPTVQSLSVETTPTPRLTPSPTPARPSPTATALPTRTPAGNAVAVDDESDEDVISDACLNGGSPNDGDASPTVLQTQGRLTPPNGVPLPAPYQPIAFKPDRQLEEELLEVVGSDADDYAFVVKDLTTGEGAMHNAERVFNAASVFKLFVMYGVFHQQSLGLVDWRTELVITPYYDDFGLSPRVTELCQVLTVAEAMEAMLSVSDNAAAVLLQDLAGAGNINNAINALGLRDSGLFVEGLPLTAADVALLLEAIGRGEAVSATASSEMAALMAGEVIDNGLRGGLPAGVPVSHKTGNWSDATHDAGIVYAPGGAYVFVVLSETSHETSIIRALSEATYKHFEGR